MKKIVWLSFILIFGLVGLIGCNSSNVQNGEITQSEPVIYDVVKRNLPTTFIKSGEEVDWNWRFTLIRATKNSKAESFTIDPFGSNTEMYTFTVTPSDDVIVVENGKVITKGAKVGDYTITVTIEGENIKGKKGEMVIPITITES